MKVKDLTEIPIDKAEFCVLDVETTGMDSNSCRIIEIGMVRVSNLKITETFQSFVNPGCEIPYFITQLTGIRNDDVYEAPYFDEIQPKIEEFIGSSILVAHNVQFDYSFLKRAYDSCGVEKIYNHQLCTLRLSRKMYPELQSKALSSVTKHLRIRHKDVHRALGDASVTAKILIKMLKQLKEDHGFKSVSDIMGFQAIPFVKPEYRIIKKKLANDYSKVPDSPGVYFFKNSKDEIIYVGKAKSLKTRVKNHFSTTAPAKSRKIVRQASRLGFEVTNSELTALMAEAEYIKIYNPVHNKMLKKYGKNYFIRMLTTHDCPRPEFSGNFDFDGNDYFGPYTNRDTVHNIIKMIDRTFLLRECKEREFDSHRECYLTQILRCLGPCTDKKKYSAYDEELYKVYEFLAGKNQIAVNRLIERMKDFSERHKYEEASQVRDLIKLVLSQIHKTSILAEPVNQARVLVEVNTSVKKDLILLIAGKIYIKNFVIKESDNFDTALDDYFEGNINVFDGVDRKDLEKMKIMLNWLIRNRNSARLYYLKDFSSKKELFEAISQARTNRPKKISPRLDISHFQNG